MKTKDGPPFFNEGDEGGGRVTKVGGKVEKASLSVILAYAGIQGPMKTKDGPPFFNEGDEGGGRLRRLPFPSFSRRRESIKI